MKPYYLAVDIGASGGRHILAWKEEDRMHLEEIYRFKNGMNLSDTEPKELCWDTVELFAQIKAGMKRCSELGKIPVSMGIDTWGVDFVLLDGQDRILGNAVGYRDKRTDGMDRKVNELISPEELYKKTGIQKQIFNTIYQLMAIKENDPQHLAQAESMLMIPDYFHFLLTGIKCQEYTNATTSQLVNHQTKTWDEDLIDRLGLPQRLFKELAVPGTAVGGLTKELQAEVGFDCQVVLPATHDTGSAVAAVPSNEEHALYISSGTWSLMGTELETANDSPESRIANFTNEGGCEYRFRFLKNIMGLWMIQSARKEWNDAYSFAELCEMAGKETIPSIIHCNDDRFLAPDSMLLEISEACKESGQQVPKTPGEMAAVIYNSLAECYAGTLSEMNKLTGIDYRTIHIVGGGSNADYLNQLTANATGCTVYAGPGEATAIGNLAVQMIRAGEFRSLKEARDCIFSSFSVKKYSPE